MKSQNNPAPKDSARGPTKALQVAFLAALAAFAWLRFSYNGVDPDLWGHVLYGQRAWLRGSIERVDTLSWTAAGRPWMNHEVLSEAVMGWAHRLGGGTGLWLLMITMAFTTVGLALREGMAATPTAQKWVALLLFGASINFIVTGYSVRPQLFTMLALVIQIILMRRIAAGRLWWALAIPALFALWVNFHGGFLLGLVLLVVAAAAPALQAMCPSGEKPFFAAARPAFRAPASFFLAAILAGAGALCNPWGWKLVGWTAQSVLLPRPNITEWQPLGLTAITGLPALALVFYIVLAISVSAWAFTRRPRSIWEAAVLALLAINAIQHMRHTGLFGLANLMLTPPHLTSVVMRLAPHCPSLANIGQRPRSCCLLAAILASSAIFSVFTSVSIPGRHLFTMDVERSDFPEAAVDFMRTHKLYGNTITYFDWGQYVLWELPKNPVSFDGRLDTVYPAAVMEAHWRLYRGEDPGSGLNCDKAEVALLPALSPATQYLINAGWKEVYYDSLAAVLVKTGSNFPQLERLTLPVTGGDDAAQGWTAFPSTPAILATSSAPR